MLTPEHQWDGVKGGAAWKSRVERYFITKAPVLRELLELAEAQDADVIIEAQVIEASSNRLTSEQAMAVNSQIWGPWHGRDHVPLGGVPQCHRRLAQAGTTRGPRPRHPLGNA